MNTASFTPGMTVYASDGAALGQIEEIWAQTASHGLLPLSRYLIQDYGPIRGTAPLLTTDDGYLQIRQDSFLGFGGRVLQIPLSAVERVDNGVAMLRHPAIICEVTFETAPVERRAA